MSLLVLIVLDFEQKAAMNRLVKRREEELQRHFNETKPGTEEPASFYRYKLVGKDGKDESDTKSKSKLPEHAEVPAKTVADKEEVSFMREEEYLSTIYNRHVERFLYSHKLSESMLRTRWPTWPH